MGSKINNNFDPKFPAPLDGRIVVADTAERDALVTDGLAYEGMIVYTKDNGADLAVMEQYVNAGTVTLPDLQWLSLTGGGGGGAHNSLTGIQGGLPTTEYYHLTQRQHTWVKDQVPFQAPGLSLVSNQGPSWSHGALIPVPLIMTASFTIGEATDVKVRVIDLGNSGKGLFDTGGSIIDLDGWFDATMDASLGYTFAVDYSDGSGDTGAPPTEPVDTSIEAGESRQFRAEMTYKDLQGATQSKSTTLTYTAAAKNVDQIWASVNGYVAGSSILVDPINDPPKLSDLKLHTKAQASAGIDLNSTVATNMVFVIHKNVYKDNPSNIQIWQNSVNVTSVFKFTEPYTGDSTAGGEVNSDYIQLHAVQTAFPQTYEIRIV